MKKELLSPAGSIDALKQAIHNGCDAVYLGGKRFGARMFASNFDDEEMVQAIKYCHLYGVKIYVTVNTMIYENELDEVIDYVRFLHKNKVDALIVQDIGLIREIRKRFPNLELHASTQLHTHNQKQIELLEELGIKRVVVAREMTIKEINNIKTKMEIEAFVHGALCVCYSGQCLFSSLLLNRSGNRGECAGICRLPFKLYENDHEIKTNGNYLLSTKELNTLDHIEELMNSNITSFKIEGRMKNPTTIGYITRLYRMLIDNYENNKSLKLSDEQIETLKLLFNREFTAGYLFNNHGKNLMNIKTPNHVGVDIGKVIEVNNKKIKIKLFKELTQEDGIRFVDEDKGMIVNFLYNEKGLLINHADSNSIIEIDNKVGLSKSCLVAKTIDAKKIKELEAIQVKKIPIFFRVEAKLDDDFKLIVSDGYNRIEKNDNIILKAINNPTTEDRIKEQLFKTGNTPFIVNNIELDVDDNIFIPIKEINNIRRDILNELIRMRENTEGVKFKENTIDDKYNDLPHQDKICLNVLTRTEEQLKTCLELKIDNIYTTDIGLYKKYKDKGNVYLRLERVSSSHGNYQNEKLLITETGSIAYGNNNKVVSDYYFNVANSSYIKYLFAKNISRVTLSVEMTFEQVSSLTKRLNDLSCLEVIVYGRIEAMIMKYCPLNMLINNDKFPCGVCRNGNNYSLVDRNNEKYPLLHSNELTHILNYKALEIQNINDYIDLGIKNYRIELFDEDSITLKNIVKKIKNFLS